MALDWGTFDKLKEAFSVEKLTKEFYNRLFAWYQWALSDEMNVRYPNHTDRDDDDREINEHIIRLITRLMFVWFLKQKHLVPDNLFDPTALKIILKPTWRRVMPPARFTPCVRSSTTWLMKA